MVRLGESIRLARVEGALREKARLAQVEQERKEFSEFQDWRRDRREQRERQNRADEFFRAESDPVLFPGLDDLMASIPATQSRIS